MQDYRYLAAVTALSHAIDDLPQAPQKLPYGVLADWMEAQGIDAEDILLISGAEVRAVVADLIERARPTLPNTS